MRNVIRIILLCLVLAWIANTAHEIFTENNKDLTKHGVLGEGIVVKLSGRVAFVEHFVKGQKFSGLMSATPYGLVLWERYRILYDPEDPNHLKVLIDQPFFSADENTIYGEATIEELTTEFVVQPLVTFRYEVNNQGTKQIFERSQYLTDSFRTEFPHIREGNKYQVRYWSHNPARAIIDLHKPL